MQQTANYQLKKWDKQDRILMQDFNDNSDAIDAALENKMGRTELIRQVDFGACYEKYVTIQLDDIDWSRYCRVLLCFQPNVHNDSATFAFRWNDGMMVSYTSNSTYDAKVAMGPFLLELLPFHDGSAPVRSILHAGTTMLFCGNGSFDELTSVQLAISDGTPLHSKSMTIWGET